MILVGFYKIKTLVSHCSLIKDQLGKQGGNFLAFKFNQSSSYLHVLPNLSFKGRSRHSKKIQGFFHPNPSRFSLQSSNQP
ncbi:hypothetical protein HanRHA438_Chr07g0321411 [Helianthus annuus]|nr:hypothetical protein HanRHA438_Chr07g0321411 [Helianthus annuus]